MVTVIKVKRSGNSYYIERSTDAYMAVHGKAITLVAHEIANGDYSSGEYCLFFSNLAEIEQQYKVSDYHDTMSFAEYIHNFANVKVQK